MTDSVLLQEVFDGLSHHPRRLPTRLLYDALGSALFDAICELPWYPITRAERAILERHGSAIITADIASVIELGPGDGSKLALLMERAPAKEVALVDLSEAALMATTDRLRQLGVASVAAYRNDYLAGLREAIASGIGSPRAVLFLGSNIGNFAPDEAVAFLQSIAAILSPADRLVLGADLVKPVDEMILAYDDPLGVTAAFNRNILARLNRELGTDFDLSAFSHQARWNPSASRIEMHLVSGTTQRVTIPGVPATITIDAGETIWTESSYKFTPERIAALLRAGGFEVMEQWIEDGFAENIARRVKAP